MKAGLKFTGLLLVGVLCLPVVGRADTQATPHHAHKAKKQPALPPPLPSGPQGPVPPVPLDAIAPVAPQVTYQDGQLTIVAPNSTLGDVLRSVRKHTSADIEVPPTATERVVTRLGPGPAPEVMAELLNGSHFNYILLGSPDNANQLIRVVLVAKSNDTPTPAPGDSLAPSPAVAKTNTPDADPPDDAADDNPDQGTAEAEQPPAPADQPGPKTPQQMLQEMQQRQLQMQQRPGQPGFYPGRPGAVVPPGQPQDQQ